MQYIFRYNCFLCDYDVCIGCKDILEEKYNADMDTLERNGVQVVKNIKREMSKVVCLKTLCERVSELEKLKQVKEKLELVNTAINTVNDSIDKNENTDITMNVPGSKLLLSYETIPLIDVQADAEEVPEPAQMRPKSCSVSNLFPTPEHLLVRGISCLRKDVSANVLDSPDIFHLRAPLVSWENFMTPATSDEKMVQSEN